MDARGLEPVERVSASKKLQRGDARAILDSSSHVVIAKGRNVEFFDTRGGATGDVLDRFLGTTGNLRAPLVRAGTTTLVGFNEEAWAEALG